MGRSLITDFISLMVWEQVGSFSSWINTEKWYFSRKLSILSFVKFIGIKIAHKVFYSFNLMYLLKCSSFHSYYYLFLPLPPFSPCLISLAFVHLNSLFTEPSFGFWFCSFVYSCFISLFLLFSGFVLLFFSKFLSWMSNKLSSRLSPQCKHLEL